MDPEVAAGTLSETQQRSDIYRLISVLNAHFRDPQAGLPGDVPAALTWAGVLFRVRRTLLLAPLDQIVEVLEPPAEITVIPGTRAWVVGVANNRGTLLPIFDLSVLVHGGTSSPRPMNRVLVVRQEDVPCGLLVSEAIGIRHFEPDSRVAEPSHGLGVLAPFAESAFPLDGAPVTVLALDRLLADPLLRVTEL
jgi:twitching motility protein PilI